MSCFQNQGQLEIQLQTIVMFFIRMIGLADFQEHELRYSVSYCVIPIVLLAPYLIYKPYQNESRK